MGKSRARDMRRTYEFTTITIQLNREDRASLLGELLPRLARRQRQPARTWRQLPPATTPIIIGA